MNIEGEGREHKKIKPSRVLATTGCCAWLSPGKNCIVPDMLAVVTDERNGTVRSVSKPEEVPEAWVLECLSFHHRDYS